MHGLFDNGVMNAPTLQVIIPAATYTSRAAGTSRVTAGRCGMWTSQTWPDTNSLPRFYTSSSRSSSLV
eukprot:scaffold99582_cov19-Prasinocladus_malaysianus.AAC.1